MAAVGQKQGDSISLQVHFPNINNAEQLALDVAEALRTTDALTDEQKARIFRNVGYASAIGEAVVPLEV